MPLSALDLRVFILINGVMACLMAMVLFSQSRSYPDSIRGLRQWAIGQGMAFLSTLLFGLQGALPPLVTMGLSNVMLVLAGGYLLVGTSEHYGHPLPRLFLPALLAVAVPIFAVLSTDVGYYLYRLLGVCIFMSILLPWQAAVIWRRSNRKFAARLTFIVLIVLSAVIITRAITALIAPLPIGIFANSPMQAIYLGSFSFGLLLSAIGAILMASEQLHRELEQLASKDSLTGAFTRRALFELGENEVARCKRQGSALSALMLDLDHFKDVNDHHGHQIGDQVLIDFVQRIQGVLRRPAILGRYGGEEFLVLLPDTARQDALLAAERIRQSSTTQANLPHTKVSIGVASLGDPQTDGLPDLIGRADAALYRAKQLGRNRVEEAPQ